MKERVFLLTLIFCFSIILPGIAPEAGAQADQFYKGKTIRIMVGSTAGGFYDRWGRLFGKYMSKYIPGQPEIIVQNVTGAGSVIVTNQVYNVAKPDGLTLVMPLNGVYIDQFVGRKEVQFDMRKFRFIGSPVTESIIFYMRADAPYKSIADIIKAKEPPKCGGSGTASSDYILSKVLEETVGAKFNTVLGYAGGTEIDLAVEKTKWFAALIVCPPTSAGNPSILGIRGVSTGIWFRPRAKKIPASPMRPRLTSPLTNIRCRPTAAALRRCFWPRGILAGR